jgi:hypothetical protein
MSRIAQYGDRAVDWIAGKLGFDYCWGLNYFSLCHQLSGPASLLSSDTRGESEDMTLAFYLYQVT